MWVCPSALVHTQMCATRCLSALVRSQGCNPIHVPTHTCTCERELAQHVYTPAHACKRELVLVLLMRAHTQVLVRWS